MIHIPKIFNNFSGGVISEGISEYQRPQFQQCSFMFIVHNHITLYTKVLQGGHIHKFAAFKSPVDFQRES